MTRLSIRGKFVLMSALMAALPWFGVQFVRETEAFLRDNLERSVAAGAAALAIAVGNRGELASTPQQGNRPRLYAHPLKVPPQVDGYDDDWAALAPHAQPLLPRSPDGAPADARYWLATHDEHLYVLLRVTDEDVVYADPREHARGDSVFLLLHDQHGRLRRYQLASAAPGWVSAFEQQSDRRDRYEPRIRAEWQTHTDGYTLEMRLPRALLAGSDLGLLVKDRDRLQARQVQVSELASAWQADTAVPLPLVLPSPVLALVLDGSGLLPGRRVRVLDANGYVVARAGSLGAIADPEPVNPLVAWLLPPPDAARLAALPDEPQVQGALLDAALAGTPARHWRDTGQEGVFVVAVAEPVHDGGRVAGAVLVEESTSAVLSARRRALASLFDATLLTGVIGTVALLAFAGRVSARLQRLRDSAEHAIDPQGRIRAPFPEPGGSDEIGDLGRSFAALLRRLHGYNDYLENLARRLSHELRTPLAVVRSSLEAMAEDPDDTEAYRERAHRGVDRLDGLLTRMAEASRIERSVEDAVHEPVRLDRLLQGATAGYRDAFAPRRFELRLPPVPVTVHGAPDLLVQMLDKLVANAVDFGEPAETIVIALERDRSGVAISVTDIGPTLPDDGTRLFESMVSVRPASGGDERQPHLGLGLYIVRLIAECHGGRARADNLPDGRGARIQVMLPASEVLGTTD